MRSFVDARYTLFGSSQTLPSFPVLCGYSPRCSVRHCYKYNHRFHFDSFLFKAVTTVSSSGFDIHLVRLCFHKKMFRMILGYGKNHQYASKHPYELGFRHNQIYSLVNVKLKWVKDRVLDTVVTGERELRAAWVIMSMIAVDPGGCLPIYRLSGRQRGPLGLPQDLKVSTFIRKYPNIFDEFHVPDSGGTLVPWFKLTADAITLNQEAIHVFQENQKDVLERVCKLLMLTRDMILPIATIDQLKWDLGLPFDYVDSFIPNYKDVFSRTNTQTVVLREAYDGGQLVYRHPVSEIRNKFASLLKEGFLGRSQGLYKKQVAVNSSGKDELYQVSEAESCENGFESEEESKDHMFSEYKYDETTRLF
ncbi:hypothetical protein E3N88_46298 [Mikania micrantha]|uniref:PORR domain-containing protein n=1 Tax=Mikania micrantha TaxID=192012 RepID=A0A5N6L6M1_9ASTR|nr:hypothetical protein E3N88_46298 [Mikania micrantha]